MDDPTAFIWQASDGARCAIEEAARFRQAMRAQIARARDLTEAAFDAARTRLDLDAHCEASTPPQPGGLRLPPAHVSSAEIEELTRRFEAAMAKGRGHPVLLTPLPARVRAALVAERVTGRAAIWIWLARRRWRLVRWPWRL